MSTAETIDLIAKYQSSGRKFIAQILGALDLESHSNGSWIHTSSGKSLLDFGSYSVFLLGHRHPVVISAVKQQLDLMPGSSRVLMSEILSKAGEAICSIAPEGLNKTLILSTGTEAVEASLKLARIHTGRENILAFKKAFHGKTLGSLSVTDNQILQKPFGPLLPGISFVDRISPEKVSQRILKEKPAAIILEPIQGEAGIFTLSNEMLISVREACNVSGALLIADEIQSGLGRSGAMWASDAAKVKPDILLMGKALGGGVMPASAVVTNSEIFEPFDRDPFLHSSTFGGNPLACAAIKAAIDVILSEDIPALCFEAGKRLKYKTQPVIDTHSNLFDCIRGRGLLLGLVCNSPAIASNFLKGMLHEGVLMTPCLSSPSVIRISPSAFIGEKEITTFTNAFEKIADKVSSGY